ncbi:MAG: TldD/PmbA family protein [Microcystaceae cyanobacterium]
MNLEKLIDLSLKAGVSHAEVYQSYAVSHPVFFEANRLKQLESSQSEGVALRVWKEGCPGLAVAYGEVDASVLVEKAIALSSLNTPETPELSEPRQINYTDTGKSASVETLVEMGKTAIATLRDAYPEVLCSGEFEAETEKTILLNSQGLDCQWTDTAISYYLGVEWVRGEDFLGIYDGDYCKTLPNTETVLQRLLQRLNWSQRNAKPLTGNIPILFTPNAATLLWGMVSNGLNGKRKIDKSSPWSDKQGKLVVSPKLTLHQDPTLEPHFCPFDDEGTPTQPLSLIKEGCVEDFYCDRKTARKLGIKSTGNGFRPSLSSYPSPSLVNLIVQEGNGTLTEFISQLDNGLLVDQMLGERGDISGDISVNVDLGYRIEQGKIVGRVKDTMVSGNLYTALQNISLLGSDQRWSGSYYTPSVGVEGLSIVS